ncbi:peroxisomal membrane protein PEX14 [Aspergillus homomorphus CBS 101889]|uniref:Peroxisomal membrane protein PEX14 n=1 Tax=Aspergillus homomorphus (strain CBS 101889) TaxID=1450537 RepID=A0A395IF37_ASPHC|nr:hypothetical protein BO97DRAFT_402296 [Aspergillus homomorphus CBS 101889]RAL17803.1 hypothetical protein BO97DRAFT_402296 [Aspergillus homomorphus CBS 101889]
MADSKPKSAVPEWQKSHATSESGSNSSDSSESSTTTVKGAEDNETDDQPSRPALLDQAAKFLQDDSIRDAPMDRKRVFLESKGLRDDEIDLLLRESSGEETSSSSSSSSSSNEHASDNETTTTTDNNTNTQTSVHPPSSPPPTTTPTTPKTMTPREIPPIITYPEFLTTPPTQPPLLTLRSTLYTLYAAAGLATTFYAGSEYLVKPMIAELTTARHSLARTTATNLRTLNSKLSQTVSTIPPAPTDTPTTDPETETDTESITSDPTELFHRDVAVQTTDPAPTQPTLVGTTEVDDQKQEEDKTKSAVEIARTHTARMQALKAQLRELSDADERTAGVDTALRGKMNDLHHYLDTFIYSKPGVYNPMAGYGVFSTPGLDATGAASGGVGSNAGSGGGLGLGKGEEDAIASFRAEIRGVKGALLSARNFPAGGGRGGNRIAGRFGRPGSDY